MEPHIQPDQAYKLTKLGFVYPGFAPTHHHEQVAAMNFYDGLFNDQQQFAVPRQPAHASQFQQSALGQQLGEGSMSDSGESTAASVRGATANINNRGRPTAGGGSKKDSSAKKNGKASTSGKKGVTAASTSAAATAAAEANEAEEAAKKQRWVGVRCRISLPSDALLCSYQILKGLRRL